MSKGKSVEVACSLHVRLVFLYAMLLLGEAARSTFSLDTDTVIFFKSKRLRKFGSFSVS